MTMHKIKPLELYTRPAETMPLFAQLMMEVVFPSKWSHTELQQATTNQQLMCSAYIAMRWHTLCLYAYLSSSNDINSLLPASVHWAISH